MGRALSPAGHDFSVERQILGVYASDPSQVLGGCTRVYHSQIYHNALQVYYSPEANLQLFFD
jgi:hypothetical protein